MQGMVTIMEAAKRLDCSYASVYAAITGRKLEAIKSRGRWHVSADSVEKLRVRRAAKAAPPPSPPSGSLSDSDERLAVDLDGEYRDEWTHYHLLGAQREACLYGMEGSARQAESQGQIRQAEVLREMIGALRGCRYCWTGTTWRIENQDAGISAESRPADAFGITEKVTAQ